MNQPLGIGNGKRGPRSRRTSGRASGCKTSSTLRGIPAAGSPPTGPRGAGSLVRTSVIADPLGSWPRRCPTGFPYLLSKLLRERMSSAAMLVQEGEDRSMNDLRAKVAVVTGGASGIGLALVQAFHDEAMRVVIADVDPAALAAAEAQFAD